MRYLRLSQTVLLRDAAIVKCGSRRIQSSGGVEKADVAVGLYVETRSLAQNCKDFHNDMSGCR